MFVSQILYNGNIRTLDPAQPRASALALIGERIAAVGDDAEILALATARTRRDNLDGRTVVPGFTDGHMHWRLTADALQQVNLFEVLSLDEAVNRVAAWTNTAPVGEWVRGWGWTQDVWASRAFPTRHDLDRVAPDHPVYLQGKSVHVAWVNTRALARAGITRETPDPAGGQIQRDANGDPTGILFEMPAMELVKAQIPAVTPALLADRMAQAQAHALSLGVTGFHDYDDPDCLEALQILRERDQLALRVMKHINLPYIRAAVESGLRFGFGDDWLRIGALKMFADGALGPRTAWMIAPYDSESDNYGMPVDDVETMTEAALLASAHGLPTTIHAIGDRAVHEVLNVFEVVRRAEAERGDAWRLRHRIEHIQVMQRADLDRLAGLRLIASMQPLHATSDMDMADSYWGARSALAYNPREQLDRGVVVVFGSDSPVDDMNPLRGIHAAVTRRRRDGSPGADGWYPAARVSLDEALHAYTVAPAYASGREGYLGRLAAGCLADLVVLDHDLYGIDPHDIQHVRVVATMTGGVWRYNAPTR